MGGQQVGEVVGQLRLGERLDPMVEVVTGSADGAGVGVDGLRLQALELQVLEMGLVEAIELGLGWGLHGS